MNGKVFTRSRGKKNSKRVECGLKPETETQSSGFLPRSRRSRQLEIQQETNTLASQYENASRGAGLLQYGRTSSSRHLFVSLHVSTSREIPQSPLIDWSC